ncbi:DUF808 domain-containing protein [Oceanibium sediminis]|uniref:DUF808 domain-containing protein n=1 Tax=Oceanibium sediminis TaxID=2026339 RepID=UPI000DD3D092|nr:DUF808 domain-containing protein [Oceanibium sediminis]
MSGLLALLDDVAALAKLAATQVDDVAAQAVKVGSKAAGVVIDDAAVTPKYVHGLPAARELPIVYKIARGSIFNKLVILLPVAMLLNAFAPWMLTPLLMLGGLYLSFEGAEKIHHVLVGHGDTHEPENVPQDPAHLEKERVAGAIKTDFILSAEIMTITLAAIEADSLWIEGVILAIVAVAITLVVYGSVAVLVKADDVGLRMSLRGRLSATRAAGRAIVKGMPGFLTLVSTIGTAAMLWVGGSILIHGLVSFGWQQPYAVIHDLAEMAANLVGPRMQGFAAWFVTALLDGLVGLAIGLTSIPVVQAVILPLVKRLKGQSAA